MDPEKTQAFPHRTRRFYRCPCGNEVEFDPQIGAKCAACRRAVPASLTQTQLSMTMTMTSGQLQMQSDDTSQDEMVGRNLGHFEVLEPIGRGGMGQVYRALDTSLQRYVAVKVLKGAGATELDSVGEQTLLHEAIAQARVNHPNIVTIFYVGREQEIPFLAMELVAGQDMAEKIQHHPLPYTQIVTIALKISHALETASKMGIVHGDIKPKNLLIVEDGDVKLSDFGMARIEDSGHVPEFGGTPNYLAPELLRGEAISVQSDMYSLGVTLYEMTFGRLPISMSGKTIAAWTEIHAHSRITFPEPWPDHLPQTWRSVLTRLLAKDPHQRFESYSDLREELASILPSRFSMARLLPRVIAFAIDSATIFGLLAALQIVSQLLVSFTGIAWGDAIDCFFAILALAIYTSVAYVWRHSLGHELLHIRVINQFGFAPSRRKSVIRSVLRMSVFWTATIGFCLGYFIRFAFPVLALAGMFFLAIDVIFLALAGRGRSIHDRIVNTHVVVGAND